MAERVWVVERSAFFGGDWPQGYLPLGGEAAGDMLAGFASRGFFAERSAAETRPSWKQLIPYCIVSRGDEVFCVQRLSGQSETRLHGRRSIGIGGHVNPDDAGDATGLLERALWRELEEELVLPGGYRESLSFLGILNDDDTAVGAVHAGLVHQLDLPADTPVTVRETEKMRGRFESRDGLRNPNAMQTLSGFESWSAILLAARWWRGP